MGYKRWFIQHGEKHAEIVGRLADLSDDEIIDYFIFENMLEKETDFCPLYAKNKKCHDMKTLNCYFCACPYFRFDDDSLEVIGNKAIKSKCDIDAKDGSTIEHENVVHQNCSNCILPHTRGYIKQNFSRDWFEVMRSVHRD